MTIGDRIRTSRLQAGLTQEDLAKASGTSKQTIYKYEMNIVTNIPSDRIESIAQLLNVSPAYLMGWENPKSKVVKKMNIKDLIKDKRIEKNLTMKELAELVGVSEATISRWESGEVANMKRTSIIALSKILGITPSAFISGFDDPEPQTSIYEKYTNILPITTKKIPLLGEIACGEPIYADQDLKSYVEVGANIHADFALRAKGDSMIGARINDGDLVFIRKQPMVANGEIAAVIIDDEATLKRIYYQTGEHLVLQAENPAYQPLVYENCDLDQIHILGKAIAFQSDVL